jgi:hypothetical protein
LEKLSARNVFQPVECDAMVPTLKHTFTFFLGCMPASLKTDTIYEMKMLVDDVVRRENRQHFLALSLVWSWKRNEKDSIMFTRKQQIVQDGGHVCESIDSLKYCIYFSATCTWK